MTLPNFNSPFNQRLLLGALAGMGQQREDTKPGLPAVGAGSGIGVGPAGLGAAPPAGQLSLPMGLGSILPPANVIPPQIPFLPQISFPPQIPTPPQIPISPRIPRPQIPIPPQDLDIPRYQGSRTSTILARSALALLEQASRENLDLALNTLTNKNIPAERLFEELERSPFSYQQVLSELARGWRQEDVSGFAEKFGMPREQLDVMDVIVSLAILNDPALEIRLRAEYQVPSTPTDFASSRRVVWQSVEPGSVLNPPYVILIAVEAVDAALPNDVVQSILGQLAVFRGYNLPQVAVARLSGSPVSLARTAFLNPQVLSLLANRVSAVAPLPENVSVRLSSPSNPRDRQNAAG